MFRPNLVYQKRIFTDLFKIKTEPKQDVFWDTWYMDIFAVYKLQITDARPALHKNIFRTPMARYSLYVLKVPLNTDQLK